MRRRAFLLALAAAAAPAVAMAQATDVPRTIGFISLRSGPNEYDAAFTDALKGLGYVEGRTVRIERHWAGGSEARATEAAASLVSRKVDLIVAATTPAVRAAMRATDKTPIVIAVAADPVGSGLVASLARPGGNVTGLSLISSDTGMKRMQLLRELVPAATRMAVILADSGAADQTLVNTLLVEQLRTASAQLGLSLTVATIGKSEEVVPLFASLQQEQAQAVIVQASPVTIDSRRAIADMAAHYRMPAMYETEGFVAVGGLLSYGPDIAAMYRRAATYVDKVLKGASPADLPVEQPTEFRLVINMKAADALGLRIPAALLARADQVLE